MGTADRTWLSRDSAAVKASGARASGEREHAHVLERRRFFRLLFASPPNLDTADFELGIGPARPTARGAARQPRTPLF